MHHIKYIEPAKSLVRTTISMPREYRRIYIILFTNNLRLVFFRVEVLNKDPCDLKYDYYLWLYIYTIWVLNSVFYWKSELYVDLGVIIYYI